MTETLLETVIGHIGEGAIRRDRHADGRTPPTATVATTVLVDVSMTETVAPSLGHVGERLRLSERRPHRYPAEDKNQGA